MMNRSSVTLIILITILGTVAINAQNLPSTVTLQQWKDSWLAKWQSGSSDDAKDAIAELSSLLLLLDNETPDIHSLRDRLQSQSQQNNDALIAIALKNLQSGFPDQAAESLLELILKLPQDPRVNRFRIGLARAFRQDERFDLAVAQLEPILELKTPDGRWATLEYARILRTQGDNQTAINIYQSILDSQPSRYLGRIARAEKLDTNFSNVIQEESESE